MQPDKQIKSVHKTSEKARAAIKRYNEEHKEELREKRHLKYLANKEKFHAAHTKWKKENPERYKAIQKRSQ